MDNWENLSDSIRKAFILVGYLCVVQWGPVEMHCGAAGPFAQCTKAESIFAQFTGMRVVARCKGSINIRSPTSSDMPRAVTPTVT